MKWVLAAKTEELKPGKPLFFATAMTHAGHTTGLLVESHEGRPTKIEGNPDHPASLGAAGVLEQASILQLYDPHRARAIRYQALRVSSPFAWESDLLEGHTGFFLTGTSGTSSLWRLARVEADALDRQVGSIGPAHRRRPVRDAGRSPP